MVGRVFDGEALHEDCAVVVENGMVREVSTPNRLSVQESEVVELGRDDTLVPGFIDLQVNGGGGVLFNDSPTLDAVRTIGAAHRRFGTTGFLPTLITDTYEVMKSAIDAVDDAIVARVPGVLGIHLEGPFLNKERKGIHDASRFCTIDEEGFDLITSLKSGVTVVTIAPELTSKVMIRRLSDAGIIVCAGHSGANFEQSMDAIEAGVVGFTHLFNGMTGIQSREPGMVGAALSDDRSWFGIIADGHHVHPSIVKLAVKAKPTGGAVLVTDAMSTVGTDQMDFRFGDRRFSVKDGQCISPDGGLAGSKLDMHSAVSNMVRFANIERFEAIRMASTYPARALNLANRLGLILPGYAASFVVVDSTFNIRQVWIDGVCH